MARVGQQIVGLDEDRLPGRVAVGVLTRVFPPGLVDEVVAAAKVGEQRIRILPARLVVYYALAMIVFFQSSYAQVWVKLIGGLGWARSFRARVAVGMSPSPAAICKARGRLGWQVMADLLDRVAGPLAGQGDGWAHVAGPRLVAFDGLTMDVPDTEANAEEFGRPGGGSGPGAFPQVRVVALAECGSRAVMGARCAGITTGEQALTAQLMGLLGAGMLVVADRNFLSHKVLKETIATGAHPLLRARSDIDGVRAGDLLDRDFTAPAPNRVWVTDFTYVRTWVGFCYVAFVVDVFAQRIVGWHAMTTKPADLVLIPLRIAAWSRGQQGHPITRGDLIAHSDEGAQAVQTTPCARRAVAGSRC